MTYLLIYTGKQKHPPLIGDQFPFKERQITDCKGKMRVGERKNKERWGKRERDRCKNREFE